ncbi:MAG TPA: hypothetical protein PKL63_14405 [Dermatophilaceae bacterium]|nr:hypothetical protein [Dermatophilaceae bacterium]HOR16550.1 hypothetical protein [Dermatophilaceae bacterium]
MSPITVVANGELTAIASATTAAAASAPAYLPALLLTLVVEVPALLLLARLFARVSVPLALAGAVGVNLLTHPILYAASAGFSSWPQLLAAEALVALVEGLALAWVWRVPLRESWPLVGAFAVNALSTLAGLALYR